MITLLRALKFAFQNAWRNVWLSLITVSMLLLTLVTVNILLVLQQVTARAISFAESRIDVSVYFNETTTPERVASAAGYLRGLPQVRYVQTVTADEALTRFRERHAEDEEILRSLDEIGHNPFDVSAISFLPRHDKSDRNSRRPIFHLMFYRRVPDRYQGAHERNCRQKSLLYAV